MGKVTMKDSENNETVTANYYQSLLAGAEPNIAGLTQFFTMMPKGGDIHHHYSGSIYAETYVDWVAAAAPPLYISKSTFALSSDAPGPNNDNITIETLLDDSELYRQAIDTWSDEDFANHYHHEIPPDQQFFATFGYFGRVAGANITAGLKLLKNRARAENVQYIETMLTGINYAARLPDTQAQNTALLNIQQTGDIAQLKAVLMGMHDAFISDTTPNTNLKAVVNAFLLALQASHQGIDDDQFTMRYQTYAYRDTD